MPDFSLFTFLGPAREGERRPLPFAVPAGLALDDVIAEPPVPPNAGDPVGPVTDPDPTFGLTYCYVVLTTGTTPADDVAVNLVAGDVVISWTKKSGDAAYRVARSKNGQPPKYKLKDGEVASEVVCVDIVPDAPTLTLGDVTADSVAVTAAAGDSGADSFNYYLDGALVASGEGASYTYAGLAEGVEVSLTATAVQGGVESAFSDVVTATPAAGVALSAVVVRSGADLIAYDPDTWAPTQIAAGLGTWGYGVGYAPAADRLVTLVDNNNTQALVEGMRTFQTDGTPDGAILEISHGSQYYSLEPHPSLDYALVAWYSGGDLFKYDPVGGRTALYAGPSNSVHGLAVDWDAGFAVVTEYAGAFRALKIALSDGAVLATLHTGASRLYCAALSDDRATVYLLEQNTTPGQYDLKSVPVTGGAVTVIASALVMASEPRQMRQAGGRLYVAAGHLYTVETDGTGLASRGSNGEVGVCLVTG